MKIRVLLFRFFVLSGAGILAAASSTNASCVVNALGKIVPDSSFGIRITNGKIVGVNGDPLVVAFDMDETFARAIRSSEEARYLRRSGRQVVTIREDGKVQNYEILPGMVESLMYLEKKGIQIHFFSAGSNDRNRAILKAIRVPGKNEPLFHRIQGRLIPSGEIRFNLDPFSSRSDVIKPVRPLGERAANVQLDRTTRNGRGQEAAKLKKAHVNSHNALVVDNVRGTSIHQIWIPSPFEGGPPFDWPFRDEYIVGAFSEAVRLALKKPGTSLGAALKQVQTVDLLNQKAWVSNPLIERGREVLKAKSFTR